MFESKLQKAIQAGLRDHDQLAAQLQRVSDGVRSAREARTMCDLIEVLAGMATRDELPRRFDSVVERTVRIAGDVQTKRAARILHDRGLPGLVRLFEALRTRGRHRRGLTRLLALCVEFGHPDALEATVAAAHDARLSDDYWWTLVFPRLGPHNPLRAPLLERLRHPLPEGFVAVALLDWANSNALDGKLERHPFASPAGAERLRTWLASSNPDESSYACSAATALPFLAPVHARELLPLALGHADGRVALEAAWAAARTGDEAGVARLGSACRDLRWASRARQYLDELGRSSAAPAETDASFAARAAFADWLSDPRELGVFPDELEVVDTRELAWPPGGQPIRQWLIRYLARDRTGLGEDDAGVGLVGSATWCFFDHALALLSAEDIYAFHLCWELEQAALLQSDTNVDLPLSAAQTRAWPHTPLDRPRIAGIARPAASLHYPAREVLLVEAGPDSARGWAILDGDRSSWYTQAALPDAIRPNHVLSIHLGRHLLAFPPRGEACGVLEALPKQRSDTEIVAAYRRHAARAGDPDLPPEARRESLALVGGHLRRYCVALCEVSGVSEDVAFLDALADYERLSGDDPEELDRQLFYGRLFERLTDALIATGRQAEMRDIVVRLRDRHADCHGWSVLGVGAFRCGHLDLAEELLVLLKDDLDEPHRWDEMAVLAEAWMRTGRGREARVLLERCIQRMARDRDAAQARDQRRNCEATLAKHREAFARLFAENPPCR